MRLKTPLIALLAALTLACAPGHAPAVTSVVLRSTDGAPLALDAALRAHALTVITFFSADCPCQRAHDARLRELIARDTPRDVAFLVVDSEESATPARDSDEAKARGYPIVLDDAGKLARSLDAEYATYSVVVDRDGKVLYRGAFDSDRVHLREGRAAFVDDALNDLLAGRPVRKTDTKTLGCTLQLH